MKFQFQTCLERIRPLDQGRNQVILLQPQPRDPACISLTDPRPTTQCSGTIGFKTARPRWWYIAASNCRRRAHLKANYTGLVLRLTETQSNNVSKTRFSHLDESYDSV